MQTIDIKTERKGAGEVVTSVGNISNFTTSYCKMLFIYV